eukprot:939186-Lingulodinium_polyedra.AAC.1
MPTRAAVHKGGVDQKRCRAAQAWAKLKSNESKSFIEECFEKNPALMQEAEAFLRSKVWAPSSTSKETEQRFCRGRTQNGK